MTHLLFFIWLLIFNSPAFFVYASDVEPEILNNGEDITRPIKRFDLRLKYQTGVNSIQGKATVFTARTDQVYTFLSEWQLGLRIDLPYEWYTCPQSSQQQCNKSLNDMGDSLFQILAGSPAYDRWTYGFGVKFIFPTAGNHLQIGQGKYQVLPTVALKYDLNEWSAGSYTGFIFRHAFDIAGYKSAPYISQTYIQPTININLNERWFVNSSPEMIYNWRTKAWFIPFDLMVGWMPTKKIVLSLEYENAIVYDYPKYAQQIEFRIGYFY